MAKGDLASMVLKDIKHAEKQLAKEVAPEINRICIRFSNRLV